MFSADRPQPFTASLRPSLAVKSLSLSRDYIDHWQLSLIVNWPVTDSKKGHRHRTKVLGDFSSKQIFCRFHFLIVVNGIVKLVRQYPLTPSTSFNVLSRVSLTSPRHFLSNLVLISFLAFPQTYFLFCISTSTLFSFSHYTKNYEKGN